MGDYNLDLIKHDKHPPTEKFLDVMHDNYFIQVMNRSTRVTMNTYNLIDNISTNQYDVRENQPRGISKTDITDHCPLFYINWRKSSSSSDDYYQLIHLMNVRRKRYVSKIQNMDCSFLDSFSDCQSDFSNFIKVFKEIYWESFPQIRVKIWYRNRLPWLSDGLKHQLNTRINVISYHWCIQPCITYQNTNSIVINYIPFWKQKKKFLSKPNSTK